MRRFIIPIILVIAAISSYRECLAIDFSAARQVPAVSPSLSLTTTAGMFLFDSHRDLDASPTLGIRLGYDIIGRNAIDSLGIEAGLDVARSRVKSTGSAAEVYLVRTEAFYSVLPRERFVPSLVVGMGGMYVNGGRGALTDAFFDYGMSAKYFLRDNLAFRMDVRHIFTYEDAAARSNYESTVGVTFYLSYDKDLKRVPPVDSDGDGVPDYLDKCPDTPPGVKVDKDGCPLDSDGDGVPDYLDKCPDTPPGVKVDKDGCPLDSIGNGIPDYLNKCPETRPGVKVDKDGCLAGNSAPAPVAPTNPVSAPLRNPGRQGSSPTRPASIKPNGQPKAVMPVAHVPKASTPGKPEVKSEPVKPGSVPKQVSTPATPVVQKTDMSSLVPFDTDGCLPASENKDSNEKSLKQFRITFEMDKSDINPDYIKELQEITEFLKKNPKALVQVERHTDATTLPAYNSTISRVRAINIKNQILLNSDIAPERVNINSISCPPPLFGDKIPESGLNNQLDMSGLILTITAPAAK